MATKRVTAAEARAKVAAPRKPRAKAPADAPRTAQPHGGALLAGGVKGNRGGMSIPSALREMAREHAHAGLALAAKIAAGEKISQSHVVPLTGVVLDVELRPSHAEIVRATDMLLKHGMSAPITVDDARARVAATYEVLRATLPSELLAQVLPKLTEVWA